MKPSIVAFTGPAGVGKDTAASSLIARGYKKIAFAQGLKDMLAAIGWPEPADQAEKEVPNPDFGGVSYRRAAQTLGTEWGRGLYEDFWTDVMAHKLRQAEALVVITDLRFENEAALVRDMGGQIIHLYGRMAALGAAAAHASESGIDSAADDWHIENTGSMEALRNTVLSRLGFTA